MASGRHASLGGQGVDGVPWSADGPIGVAAGADRRPGTGRGSPSPAQAPNVPRPRTQSTCRRSYEPWKALNQIFREPRVQIRRSAEFCSMDRENLIRVMQLTVHMAGLHQLQRGIILAVRNNWLRNRSFVFSTRGRDYRRCREGRSRGARREGRVCLCLNLGVPHGGSGLTQCAFLRQSFRNIDGTRAA
jgi:hypothetical protein